IDIDKDLAAGLLREVFKKFHVTRYVSFDECWMLVAGRDEAELEHLRHIGSLEHVPGRQEAIFFSAEDRNGQMTARRLITRNEDGKPSLGPLEFDENVGISEGRFVGMLRPEGTRQ
ncbi:MAG TPA: hypothetical protein VGH32_04910, partial [Pirellulales bacterium]